MFRHVTTVLVFTATALVGCPESDPIAGGDRGADARGDAAVEVFDPTQMAPYSCEYTPAGAYSKTPADECDLIDQDCTNTMLGCSLTDQGAQCLPRGEATCGFPCERVNDCAPGLVCVGEPFACRALCRPGDPCPGNTICRDFSGRTDVGFCPVPCSVVAPDCPGGDACYLLLGRMECAPTAGPGLLEGQPCDFGDECAEGLICQDAGDRRCVQPCTTDGEFTCADEAKVCSPLTGLDPLGVCVEASP